MIMHSRANAGMFYGGYAMDHGKLAMEIHDHGKESIITPMVLVGFFCTMTSLPWLRSLSNSIEIKIFHNAGMNIADYKRTPNRN